MQFYNSFNDLVAGAGALPLVSQMSVFNLDISYANSDVEAICTQDSVMEKRFGVGVANVLKQRLQQIQQAPTLADLSATDGNWHPYTRELAGHISGSISEKERVVLKPANVPLPTFEEGKNKGKLDWSRVTAVEITGVGNYHKGGQR